MSRTETQRWGLFTEGERRADVEALKARFTFDCVYWRSGGTATWRWNIALPGKNLAATITEIERMGYPAIPGRTADGPPRKFAVEGWDDIRMRRTI